MMITGNEILKSRVLLKMKILYRMKEIGLRTSTIP